MFSISLYLNAERDEKEYSNLYVQRRLIRCGSSPLDLSHNEFVKLFRLSKDAFKYVLENIKDEFPRRRSSATPTILKLAATLRFLAEGSYQKSVGQDMLIGLAQQTVSVIVSETIEILERTMCPKMIKFEMNEAEKNEAKEYFHRTSSFPGVIMCVDGTHVNIIRPSQNEHHFYNRKGSHSINVMIGCQHQMKITCINARFGGSSHDSVIWSMSDENRYMEEAFRNGDKSKILGDSGYGLEPWLMTPYRSPAANSRESNYNAIHSKCRCKIERCIGLYKARFRCLLHARELHYKPEKAARIINVCAALHNVCIKFNVELDEDLVELDDNSPLRTETIDTNMRNVAKRIRDLIKDSL